jgi:hypothetical protein
MAEPRDDNPYRRLPDPVRPEDMVTSEDVRPVVDPYIDRDTEREFMLRYVG